MTLSGLDEPIIIDLKEVIVLIPLLVDDPLREYDDSLLHGRL